MTTVRTGQSCSTPPSRGSNVNLETVLNNGNDGGGEQIKNIADPTDDQDAATKKYVSDEISESQHYRGVYASLVALQTAIPSGNPGDYADVDAGVGTDVQRYIWDDDDEEWIEGGGASDASEVSFTPAQGIAATNVQAAIEEAKTDAIAASDPAGSAAAAQAAAQSYADSIAGGTEATLAEALAGTGSTQRMSPRMVKNVYQQVVNVHAYGALGDVKKVTDAAITSGTPNLTSATGLFTAGDVGKTIVVWGAGAASAGLYTTIAAYVSATSVTLTANAGTTVSGKRAYWGTDDTAAFTSAISAAPTYGSTLLIPTATGEGYLITSGLTIDKNMTIQGEGTQPYSLFPSYTGPSTAPFRGASTIYFNSPTGNLFTFQGNGSTNNYPVFNIYDLSLENIAGSTPTAGAGVLVTGKLAHWNIERCYIGRFYDNISCTGGMLGVIYRNSIVKPVRAGVYLNASSTPDLGGFWIYNNYIFGNIDEASTAKGVWFVAGGAVTVKDNNFNLMDFAAPTTNTYGLMYGYYVDNTAVGTSEHMIIGNHFNNYQETAISIRPNSSILQRIIISNNSINPLSIASLKEAIYVVNVPQLVVDGNQIGGPGTPSFAAIRLNSCDGISVGANWIGSSWGANDFSSSTILSDLTNSTALSSVPTAFSFNRAVSANGLVGFLGYSGTGTGAGVGFRVGTTLNNPSTNYVTMGMLGASFTTSGFLKAKSGFFESNASSNFIISNFANDDMIFCTNNRTERLRITGGGLIGAGAITPTSQLHTTAFATGYAAKMGAYGLGAADHTIEVTSGTHNQTLPTAVGITGREYVITNTGSGTVTVATTSSQTFVNVSGTPTTLTLNQFETAYVKSNGANWILISFTGTI